MKKNKGFTLIELLAVIVILAILMVIAVPKILDVIESSRNSAANSSIKLIKDGIKTNVAAAELLSSNPYTKTDGCYVFDFDTPNENVNNLKIDNKEKTGGSIKLCNGKFSDDTLTFDGSSTSSEEEKVYINEDYVMTGTGLICTIYGRNYYKKNEGEAFIAYYYMKEEHTVPILVSEDPDAVTYYTSWDTSIEIVYTTTVQYNNKTYYVSRAGYAESGMLNSSDGPAKKLSNDTLTLEEAANLLLEKVFTRSNN